MFVVRVAKILGLAILDLGHEVICAQAALHAFIDHDDIGKSVDRDARQIRFYLLCNSIGAVALPLPINHDSIETTILHVRDHRGHIARRIAG